MIAAIEHTRPQIHRGSEPQDTPAPEHDPQFAEVVGILRQISESLQLIASKGPAPPLPVAIPVGESKQARAIKLVVEFGPENLAAVAKAVGVNRGTLYRWPSFMEAVDRLRAASAWTRRTPRSVNRMGALVE